VCVCVSTGAGLRILLCVLILLYVSSYYYVCVLMLLYMCPHTPLYVSAYYGTNSVSHVQLGLDRDTSIRLLKKHDFDLVDAMLHA
jgi:hypothetical protein